MPGLRRGPRVAALECGEQQLREGGFEEALRLLNRDLVKVQPGPDGRVGAAQADVSERDGVVVVTPAGALPDPLPAPLAERLAAAVAHRPLVVDLSDVTVLAAAPVVGLVGWALGSSQECCIVCSRSSARALLRRWHVFRCLAVFASVGDALQARRFAGEGYGRGWQPELPGDQRAALRRRGRP